MPKNASKAQQRKMGSLMGQGDITKQEFDKRAVSGKAFQSLPNRLSPKKVARKLKKARG